MHEFTAAGGAVTAHVANGIPETGVPFNRPFLTGQELTYVADAVSKRSLASDGLYTSLCGQIMQTQFGADRVLMTPSCTAALEIAARLTLAPGDEALMPSFTFTSTANAILLAGAKPVFVDIRSDTLNMKELLIERSITPRTKAIIPVHYAGGGCEMDTILDVARRHGLAVARSERLGT